MRIRLENSAKKKSGNERTYERGVASALDSETTNFGRLTNSFVYFLTSGTN